jgi:hypothetical protein
MAGSGALAGAGMGAAEIRGAGTDWGGSGAPDRWALPLAMPKHAAAAWLRAASRRLPRARVAAASSSAASSSARAALQAGEAIRSA